MKIEGNTIIFKSTPENYHKEYMGLKSCTIRRISLWSEMKNIEEFAENLPVGSKIRIVNTVTLNYFERTLTDISQFEGLWVFSWGTEQ